MPAHKGPRTFTMPDGSTIYLCDACKGGIGVTLCPLHAAAPALLEALERVSSCIVPHKTEPNVVWIDTESLSTLTTRIRAAIAQAKGDR